MSEIQDTVILSFTAERKVNRVRNFSYYLIHLSKNLGVG